MRDAWGVLALSVGAGRSGYQENIYITTTTSRWQEIAKNKCVKKIKYNYVVGRYLLIYIHFVYFYNLAAEDGGRIATSWNGMPRCI